MHTSSNYTLVVVYNDTPKRVKVEIGYTISPGYQREFWIMAERRNGNSIVRSILSDRSSG